MNDNEKDVLEFKADTVPPTKGTGATAPWDTRPLSEQDKHIIEHPELYYCEICGSSWISHVGRGHLTD